MYGGRYKAEGDNTQLGVVIRNDNSTEPRARASVEEVYTQINEDIDLAIQLLGATEEKRTNKSHIDLHVARGLKARILLTQGKWLEAAEMAKLVVDLSGAKLQDDTYTTLNDRFSDQSNTEWLWGSNPLLQQAPNLTHFHGYMSNEIISYNGNTLVRFIISYTTRSVIPMCVKEFGFRGRPIPILFRDRSGRSVTVKRMLIIWPISLSYRILRRKVAGMFLSCVCRR